MHPYTKKAAFSDLMSCQQKCSSSMIVSLPKDGAKTRSSILDTYNHAGPFTVRQKSKHQDDYCSYFKESHPNSIWLEHPLTSYQFKKRLGNGPRSCFLDCATAPVLQKIFPNVSSHWETIKEMVTRKLSHRGKLSKAVLHIWDAGTRYFWAENIKVTSKRCRSLPCLSKYKQKIRNKELGYLRRLIYQFLINFKSSPIRKAAGDTLSKSNDHGLPTMFSCFDQTLQICWNAKEKDLKTVDSPLSLHDKTCETKCVSAFYFLKCDFVLQILVERIMPSPQERYLKCKTIDALASLIQKWKRDRIGVHVVGSTAYGVDCTASDLDIVLITSETDYLKFLQDVGNIIIAKQEQFARDTSLAMNLGMPHELLSFENWPLRYVTIQVVENARVPILLLKYPQGVVCDISVNTRNSLSHTDFFKTILRDKPHLRALMRLVKYWIKVRRMPVMRDGGLPNIVWMVLCVIACRHSEICYSSLAYILISGKEDKTKTCPVSELENKKKNLQYFTSYFTQWLWNLDLSFFQSKFFSSHTILLSEFFSRLATRRNLTCTVSIASGTCIPKNAKDVAQRILSPWDRGVWDELLSVEDPANFNNQFFPEAFFCSPTAMLSRTINAPNVSSNGIPTPLFQDLVSKTSSATWLVYQYELRRADVLMRTLTRHFSCFQKQLASQPAYNLLTFLKQHLKHLSDIFVNLFAENDEQRYRVPALLPDKLRRFSQSSPVSISSTSLESSSNRNSDQPKAASFHLALVLLNGKLMLLNLVKICPDRNGWWSNEFLTRRDTRSVLHGEPVYVVSLGQNKQKNHKSFSNCFYDACVTDKKNNDVFSHQWLLCNSHLYLTLLDTEKKLQHSEAAYFSNQTSKRVVLFNPSNLVCFLQMIPISSNPSNEMPSPYKLYALPEEETERIILFNVFAKQAPYWHTNLSDARETKQTKASDMDQTDVIQPAVRSCKQCGAEGMTKFYFDLGLPHDPFILGNSHFSTCPSYKTTNSHLDGILNDDESTCNLIFKCPALQILKRYFSLNEAYTLFEKTKDAPDEKFLESQIVKLLINVTEKFDHIFSRFFTALILNDSNGVVSNSGSSKRTLEDTLILGHISKEKQAISMSTDEQAEKRGTKSTMQHNLLANQHDTSEKMSQKNTYIQNNNNNAKGTTCVSNDCPTSEILSCGCGQSTSEVGRVRGAAYEIHKKPQDENINFTLQSFSKLTLKKSQTFTAEGYLPPKQVLDSHGLRVDERLNEMCTGNFNSHQHNIPKSSRSMFSKQQSSTPSGSFPYINNSYVSQNVSQSKSFEDLKNNRISHQVPSDNRFQKKTLYPCVDIPHLPTIDVLSKNSANIPCKMANIRKSSVRSRDLSFKEKCRATNAGKSANPVIPSHYPVTDFKRGQTRFSWFVCKNHPSQKTNFSKTCFINPHSVKKWSFPYEKTFCRTQNDDYFHLRNHSTTSTERGHSFVHYPQQIKTPSVSLLTTVSCEEEKSFRSGNVFFKNTVNDTGIRQVWSGSRDSNSILPDVKMTEYNSTHNVVKTNCENIKSEAALEYASSNGSKKIPSNTTPSDQSKWPIRSIVVREPNWDTSLRKLSGETSKKMSNNACQNVIPLESEAHGSLPVELSTKKPFNFSKTSNVVVPSFILYEKKQD